MPKVPTERLRIALISEHASPLAVAGGVDSGGQNIYVNHVGRALARAGHHVDVFTRRDDASLPPVVHARPGMRVIHVPAGPPRFVAKERLLPYMADFSRHTEAVARASGGYDVVHANFFMSGVVAMRLRRSLGVPFVITLHALGLVRRQHHGADDEFPDDRIAIERELVRCADRVIAECPQDRADLVTLYGGDPARLTTVPCGYDPEEFGAGDRRRARAALGVASDEFVVLQLGRIVPRKGIDNVIRSLAPLVREHGINARLLVVGGEADHPCEVATPEIRRLRLLAESLGIGSRVTFTGRRGRSELRSFYNAADVFVTTPWYEPFGITPLESMACGTPVIGAGVGGIKFSVVDRVTGFLVPPNEPGALADKLALLAGNPALARAMGRAGMHRARSMFTWERVSQQLARIYAEVARTRAPRPQPTQRRPVLLSEART
jgi:glycosyltransferase involved in cell wall biosynthesis